MPEIVMKKKHFNIPVFIPELACPFQCIYCNQRKITGITNISSGEEINKIIRSHLSTIPAEDTETELAFFGGNFTGISLPDQKSFLELAQPFITSGRIQGIRISTRPDYITPEILRMLKDYHVTIIELGAQSMDNEVLKLSKRGHTADDTINASRMILDYGFRLGLQMMTGLPGDTFEKSLYTADCFVNLGATQTRIYPALVIRGTQLGELYQQGKYQPLKLEEAIRRSKKLLLFFENAGVNVIRVGLHPSEGLLTGNDLVAGPFHPSFRELVLTEIWTDLLSPLSKNPGKTLTLRVPPGQMNYAIGYSGKNRQMLLKSFHQVRFIPDESLNSYTREFCGERSG